uniref:Uncharacterized protein n=1 Tax=Rhizophora mucronata TaxID=61149 RepID=A0A2P2NUM4_RHIMU
MIVIANYINSKVIALSFLNKWRLH